MRKLEKADRFVGGKATGLSKLGVDICPRYILLPTLVSIFIKQYPDNLHFITPTHIEARRGQTEDHGRLQFKDKFSAFKHPRYRLPYDPNAKPLESPQDPPTQLTCPKEWYKSCRPRAYLPTPTPMP